MNKPAQDSAAAGPAREGHAGLVFVAVVVTGLVAISGRSLWIDEVATAAQAMHPTLGSWWRALVEEKTAHLQMPLYMLYIWGYAKAFGFSEWALRLANLPWFVAGAAVFVSSFRAKERRWWIAAYLTVFCPFAWYYLDEARPYGIEVGASLLAAGALRRLAQRDGGAGGPEKRWLACFLTGILTLGGSSLLGLIWAGAGLAAVPVVLPRDRFMGLLKDCRGLWLATGLVLTALAAYYLWTLKIGARATAPTSSSFGSMLFVGYEIMGFGGLGPGRLELRSAGLSALREYWVWVGLYGVAAGFVVGAGLLRELRLKNRGRLVLALLIALPAAFILGTGWVAHFRVLGRHFAPVIPVVLWLCIGGAEALWTRGHIWGRGLVVLFCGLSLASCCSLRFAARHGRDDYRAAAAVARSALAAGREVWWNAAPEGARYYKVPLSPQASSGGAAILVLNPTREMLEDLATPQVVITSKPDLYDGQGTLAEYLAGRGFAAAERFPAFVVWEGSQK